jgi:hypothetical protein
MKRCKECNKLADNGDKRCLRCGAPFEYDPRVTPFSETKISLALLTIIVVALIVSNAIPLTLPDPTECSRTSYRRFKRIAEDYYSKTKNVMRQEMITTSELSELMGYKREAQAMPVPPCLEPAKANLVEYLDDAYYTVLYVAWGYYQGAAFKTESAGAYWHALNTDLAQVKDCLPNCP